tara:strand:+ start:27349 stop:28473 length:1125 start_codon:yes stop_codon:yes gene_type:complete
MSSFRLSKKTVHSDSRMSISAKHNETINKIESENDNLPRYKKELNALLKSKNNKQTNKLLTTDKKNEISDIDVKINQLNDKINSIEKCENLTEYLFNSIDFIKNIDGIEYTENNENKNDGIFKYVSMDMEKKNEDNYKMYMKQCFPEEINNIEYSANTYTCKNCLNNMCQDSSSGLNICYSCGLTEINSVSLTPEWNVSETHDFIKPYSYKRTSHFKEWITQIQGREGTHIPDNIINMIINEIKKERLTDKSLITYYKIKEFLKKLKLNKYYEHIPNIIHRITGNKQLIISQELEDKLIDMFNKIQDPFMKHCPKERKNFLSYSYTLYKFFELLNKPEYLIYFPLLKSREKLFEQERIWFLICKELDWQFNKCI